MGKTQIDRTPVSPMRKKPWVTADTLRVIGIDPGFAKTGIVLLEQVPGAVIRCLMATVVVTKKDKPKLAKDRIRVSFDDTRRVSEFYHGLHDVMAVAQPHVMSVEAYANMPGRMGGNAWKTAIVYGAAQAMGLHHHLLLVVNTGHDIKKAFSLAKNASKDAIGAEVTRRVDGLSQRLTSIPQALREHVTDAAAHAYLGFTHVAEMRHNMGYG